MGVPGTKSVLTPHNLAAKEEAFLGYIWKLPDNEYIPEELASIPVHQKWRHFARAGDDHAIGPKSYLEGITKAHHRNR